MTAKEKHMKWLAKMGVAPGQLKSKKKQLGSPYSIPSYKTKAVAELSNSIPSNGTKSPDISKATFCKKNYAMVPAYNKGPISVVTLADLKAGAGRKI